MRLKSITKFALLATIAIVAGCDVAPTMPASGLDETPAEHVALAPGTYEIMAKYPGREERRFDVAMFNESQALNWKPSYLPQLQSRLKPSFPTPSYQAKDYVCTMGDIVDDGAKFNTTGECNIPSFGETTSFQFDGKQLETEFWIRVTLHGPRVSEDGSDQTIIIRAHKVQ